MSQNESTIKKAYIAYSVSCTVVLLVICLLAIPIEKQATSNRLKVDIATLSKEGKNELLDDKSQLREVREQLVDTLYLYNAEIKLISQLGDPKKKGVIKEQYKATCGLKRVLKNKRYCLSTVSPLTLNAYIPIVNKDELIGVIYVENSLFKFNNGIVNIYSLSILLLIIGLLVAGQLYFVFLYKLNNKSLQWTHTLLQNESASAPDWLSDLLTPFINRITHKNKAITELNSAVDSSNLRIQELVTTTRENKKQFSEQLEEKSNRLAQASHDIRTPLHTILATLEIIKDNYSDPNLRLKLESIHGAAFDLKEEVDNILIYETNEFAPVKSEISYINLENELDLIIHHIGLQFTGNENLIVFSEIDQDVPRNIQIDRLALVKILGNLCSNSRKFTNSGHIAIKARCSDITENTCVLHFTVEDTGRGMTKEQVEQFGKSFKQYHSDSQRKGGVGLGLRIVHQYCKKLGATIEVNSVLSKGTAITVSLKVECTPFATMALDKQVVVIDSNTRTREALKNKYARQGYEVIAVPEYAIDDGKYEFLVANIHYEDECAQLIELAKNVELPKRKVVHSNLQAFNDIGSGNNEWIITPIHTPIDQILSIIQQRNVSTQIFIQAAKQRKLEILAVDDETINLDLLKAYLSEQNIKLYSYNDPISAIEECKLRKFDIILMDILMPQIKGYDAAKQIREHSVLNSQTPIIAATATVSNSEKELMFKAGMNDIVIKPFSKKILFNTIDRYCLKEGPTELNEIEELMVRYNSIGDVDSDGQKISIIEKLLVCIMLDNKHTDFSTLFNLFNELKSQYYRGETLSPEIVSEIEEVLNDYRQ